MFDRFSASVRARASYDSHRDSHRTRSEGAPSIAYEAPGWLPGVIAKPSTRIT